MNDVAVFHFALRTIFVFYVIGLFYIVARKKIFFEQRSSFLLFWTILTYQALWIFQGLDITDEGYNLTKAWFMLHGQFKENLDAIAGSSLINGLWLSIFGKPSILWARIGALLLISLQYTIIFKIFVIYFDKLQTFLAVLLANAIATSPLISNTSINYNNLPTTLILLSVYLLLSINERNNLLYLILTAALIVYSVFSRIVYLPFVLLPVLFLMLANKKISRNEILYYLGFIILFFLLLMVVLKLIGTLETYNRNISEIFNLSPETHSGKTHTMRYLIKLYFDDFLKITKLMPFVGIFAVLVVAIQKIDISAKFKFLILTVLTVLVVLLIQKFYFHHTWFKYLLMALILTNTLFVLLFIKLSTNEKVFIMLSYFVLLFSFVGSNNSIRQSFYSGSFSLAFIWTFLKIENTELQIKSSNYNLRQFVYIAFASILILTLLNKNYDVIRDNNRTKLKYAFKSDVLWGITSTKERVDAVDSLISFVKNNNFEKKTLLSVNSTPMLYYLLNKKHFLKDPWIITKNMFEDKLKNDKPPDMVIFATKNPRNRLWPVNNDICISEDTTLYNYFKNFVAKNSYKLAFSNRMFEIYSKTE